MMEHKHFINCSLKKNINISVIIPTFNRGWCITQAIQSVLDQNCINKFDQGSINKNEKKESYKIEIIVVDDGSTDNTQEILRPFVEKNLIKLIYQKNSGVSAARNLGIKESNGDFIAFLDSDDLWLPDKLSCQIEFFEQNPNAVICQTEEIWIRNGRRANPKKIHKKLSGMIFEPSLNLCLVSPSAVMMRRSFFDIKGLFDETLPACEDYDLWLRTSLDMPIFLIDTPCIIKKGGHNDQLSSNHSLDKYRIQSIINLLKNNLNLSGSQKKAAIKVLKEKCEIYSQGCVKRGKEDEAGYYQNLIFDINSLYDFSEVL